MLPETPYPNITEEEDLPIGLKKPKFTLPYQSKLDSLSSGNLPYQRNLSGMGTLSDTIENREGVAQIGGVVDAPVENDNSRSVAQRLAHKIGNALRPEEAEREAIADGRRWRYQLENSWMLPGSEWADEVRKNAMAEQQIQDREDSRTKAATVRQLYRQWDQLINDYKQKLYPDPEEFTRAAENLKMALEENGVDTSTLRTTPPSNLSGSDIQRKYMTDLATDVYDLQQFGEKLNEASNLGTELINQNTWTQIFDKKTQKLLSRLGGDSANMADAEKKRMQIQMMSEEDRNTFLSNVQAFMNGLSSLTIKAPRGKWSENTKAKFNQITDAIKSQDLITAGVLMLSLAQSNLDELPQDFGSYVESIDKMFDMMMENQMYAANIDRLSAYNLAKYVHDEAKAKYNNNVLRITKGTAHDNELLHGEMPEVPEEFLNKLTELGKGLWDEAKYTIGRYQANEFNKVDKGPTDSRVRGSLGKDIPEGRDTYVSTGKSRLSITKRKNKVATRGGKKK